MAVRKKKVQKMQSKNRCNKKGNLDEYKERSKSKEVLSCVELEQMKREGASTDCIERVAPSSNRDTLKHTEQQMKKQCERILEVC